MDKIQITKISLQPKIRLVKKEKKTQHAQLPQKKKKAQKLSLNNQKTIWLELNHVIAFPLCNLTSINHISLVSTPNLFEALDFWLPKLQNHMWFAPKILQKVALILSWSERHSVAMLSMQPWFNRLSLARFNFELRSVWSLGFMTS